MNTHSSTSNFHYIAKTIRRENVDALFISNLKNLRYLTNFTGSSGFAFILRDKALFCTDFRYKEQAINEIRGCEIYIEKGKREITLKKLIKKLNIRRLGFETSVSYALFDLLRKNKIELVPFKNLIEKIRRIKTEEELRYIKLAINRAEKAFQRIKPLIKSGMKERELALKLEYELKKVGCSQLPFDVIVASGKNSAMPHAKPSDKTIKKGDLVIIDWGGEYKGYFSDMTRTFIIDGEGIDNKIKIYNIVNRAREEAIQKIRAEIKAKEVDNSAREIIKAEGYDEFFGHSTGHGIGLDVHEMPSISKINNEPLKESMVFTIEPGIYIPDLGGVRIEDIVMIKDGKANILTTLSRELEIIKSR